MTNRKFNAGDKIRHKNSGDVGTIVSGDDVNGYSVHYPCDDEEHYVRKDEIEFVDAKSVFLSRLQSLLREFDAEIDIDSDDYGEKNLYFNVGDEEIQLYYASSISKNIEFPITASSIMDYIKE